MAAALFTFLTWRVYRQIKGVMAESFQADMRSFVRFDFSYRLVFRPEEKVFYNLDRQRGVKGWTWHFDIRNDGRGHVLSLHLQRVDTLTGAAGETTDLELDIPPGGGYGRRFDFGWPEDLDVSTLGIDLIYQDVYGTRWVTELRDGQQRFRRG